MNIRLKAAFVTGYERMAGWSTLLDDINLFPVADADTGRNLKISLAPLRDPDHRATPHRLLMAATGNSGNIAGAFFSAFVAHQPSAQMAEAARAGKTAAWQSVARPQAGTMLSVFDRLSAELTAAENNFPAAVTGLKQAVLETANQLPTLKAAGVVDAGAMGMFFFFEGFFHRLTDGRLPLCNPAAVFGSRLTVSGKPHTPTDAGYCIDAVLTPTGGSKETLAHVSAMGEHLVAVCDGAHLKVHFHAPDEKAARDRLAALGTVIRLDSEEISPGPPGRNRPEKDRRTVHLATDAAGSLTRTLAETLNISLIESYVVFNDRPVPETQVSAPHLYAAMRKGRKVTTAQASVFEREQQFESLSGRHAHVLYLSVGAAYTGNWETARRWKARQGPHCPLTPLDSGAASGRLGLMARSLGTLAAAGATVPDLLAHHHRLNRTCDELIFIDQLKYLAAGGRISKARGFFGDMLHLKPVVRPTRSGVQKEGVLRNAEDQVPFALAYLARQMPPGAEAHMLLQYTDNTEWVETQAQTALQTAYPRAHITLQPMSITSGVHMGPGTWALAFLLPEPDEKAAAV